MLVSGATESRGPRHNGGVPPFGHKTYLRVFIDPDLLRYDEVWAAASTWHDVFGIEPHKLVEASEGLVTDLKRGSPSSQRKLQDLHARGEHWCAYQATIVGEEGGVELLCERDVDGVGH